MKEDYIVIEQIHFSVTWYLRHKVMWPDKPLDYVKLNKDPDGMHFGLYKNHKLTSVVSLFISESTAQFRKLATLEEEQGKGYGSRLLDFIIDFAASEGVRLIWCNARKNRIGLYKKKGFELTDKNFSKGGISFVVMKKELKSFT